MAIVGLHNVPVLEPSLLRESQSSSSGRRGSSGGRRISTRASSILQMWRELEDECAVNRAPERGRLRSPTPRENGESLVICQGGEGRAGVVEDMSESENGSVINSESPMAPLNDNEDRQSLTSEQSQDLGEVERERVRQIFREWMNSGATSQTPNIPHLNRGSRAPWLGENERERVRVVREWIQMTSQQREAYGNREEQVAEIGSQIERVRDGQVLGHNNQGQDGSSRREIRRLCGRQALLDLLAKKEQERRLELQGLEATRPVSSFAHRNRIQSLIRIRCFQNMRSAERSPRSVAESELGLLRQRQTVSGLREGFLSRLDSNVNVQASDLSGGPSDINADGFRDDQTQASSAVEVVDCAPEQNDHNGDGDVGSSAALNQLPGSSIAETNLQELVAQVEARLDHAQDNGGDRRQETATISHSISSTDDVNPLLISEEPSRSESGEFSDLEESHDTLHQQYNSDREELNVHNISSDVASEALNGHDSHESGVQAEDWHEQVVEYEEREWEGSVFSNQWRDDDQVETDRQQWPGDGEESSHGALENDAGEQNDAQEDYWHEHGSQQNSRVWMGLSSVPGATASGRVDADYYSDDDNVYNMEIRELLNRRTVSSLLHSGFRESLDQLIQSYVERQTHLPDDWELHEMSPPPFAVRDQEHLDTDHEESGAGDVSQRLPPTPPPVPQGHWRQVLHNTNWSRHDMRQRPGTEWETINDLRIDMARLQQRMNTMQRMLEACMDMQIELQRSVRQEVSAALNRTVNPSDSPENVLPKDSSQWDCVRKGICCICSESNIDSLLYRCGHMCTCTKCANVLVQGNGKCPMCQAPVVEVIRAYFIQ